MLKRLLTWLGLSKEELLATIVPEVVFTETPVESPVIAHEELVVEKPVKKQRKKRTTNRNS